MADTKEQLTADRTALAAARIALLSGQAVQEYQRDGRRVVYQRMSPASITAAINDIDNRLADLDAAAGIGKPRYRALSIAFGDRRFRSRPFGW